MLTRAGLLPDHALMMRRLVHDQSEASAPQATAERPKAPSHRLRREPWTAPGDDPPQGPSPGDREAPRVARAGRSRVDPSRLAAHTPAQTRQGIRPELPVVHIDGPAPRLPQALEVCQPVGEGVLGLRIGLGEALPRPLALAPQLVPRPPRGRAGEGVLERAFDLRHDCVPRPGACPPAHLTGRRRHDGPPLHPCGRTEHGARRPTNRGLQAAEPMGLEAWAPRLHRPSVAAQPACDHLGWQPFGDERQGHPTLAPAGRGSRQTRVTP